MRLNVQASLLIVTWCAVSLGHCSAETLELGANFNENLHAARTSTLEAAHVKWIRSFLPAYEFIDGTRSLETDERLRVFRRGAQAGHRLVLTLKWDFNRSKKRVPLPESEQERECFAWAIVAARACQPDVLCLVNESFIDTPRQDLLPGTDGTIPLVTFLQRLAVQVRSANLTPPSGQPLPLSSGGFTRLFSQDMQKHPAVARFLRWLNRTDQVDMVNFHIHHRTQQEFEDSLLFVRKHVRDKPLVITEFSRVWAYGDHRNDPIGAGADCKSFASRYSLDSQMTVQEYLNACYARPVPETQFNDFLESQPWFCPNYLEDACSMMQEHGVVLATYAFVQEASGGPGPLGENSALWCLNPIFADLMTVSADSTRPGINREFFAAFVRRQKANKTKAEADLCDAPNTSTKLSPSRNNTEQSD